MEAFAGFDWDEGNRDKCRKHGVSIAEIESLFEGSPAFAIDATHSGDEERLRAVGQVASGKFVFVVFTIRMRSGQPRIRPISARYMHRKEVRRYEETKP
jgi:uncharacterized DUF497 family protein